jgi:lipoprotein NlpI
MNPDSPEVYYYLGMSKANLGNIDGAIADFFQSIDLGSRSNNLMTGLSFAYLKAEKA